MIRIYCEAATAVLKETETLTSGMLNYPKGIITFSEEWEGLGKAVICRAGEISSSSGSDPIAPEDNLLVTTAYGGMFTVPYECMVQSGVELYIGIQGVGGSSGSEVVIPTIWVSAGTIMEGVDIDEASNVGTATPTLVQQMLEYAGEIEDIAEGLDSNVIRTVEADDTYANQYGVVDVQVTDTGAGDNRTVTFSFANLKGNGIVSLGFVQTGENYGRVTVQLDDGTITTFDGVKDAIAAVSTYLEENVAQIIADYIETHPELVTTVEDGAISYQKLDGDLQNRVDLFDNIGFEYVEMV